MDERAVIIDNGSGLVKAGFSGEKLPSVVFPSIVGRQKKHVTVLETGSVKDAYIGDDAQKNRAILDLKYVLQHGVVEDWQDMKLLWEYTFDDALKVDSSEHPVMLTEAPRNPKSNRENMAEQMFEYFNVPGLSIQTQAVLSLFANGRHTGLVMDAGDGVTHTIPVWNMTVTDNAIGRVDIAGHDITDYMAMILLERGIKLRDGAGLEVVRDIKEKMSYLALDYEAAKESYKTNKEGVDQQYTLPDNTVITVGDERFRAPEILFQPEKLGKDTGDAVHLLCINSIAQSSRDIRTELLNNVVLSGGTSTISGFKERLEKELDTLAPQHFGSTAKSRVIATADRKYAVWIGGAQLADLPIFSQKWVTKQEYLEDPEIIHRQK